MSLDEILFPYSIRFIPPKNMYPPYLILNASTMKYVRAWDCLHWNRKVKKNETRKKNISRKWKVQTIIQSYLNFKWNIRAYNVYLSSLTSYAKLPLFWWCCCYYLSYLWPLFFSFSKEGTGIPTLSLFSMKQYFSS